MSATVGEGYLREVEPQLLGTVVAVQANFYQVQLDGGEELGSYPLRSQTNLPSLFLLCTRRSRLKKIGQQVMVGDRVVVEEPDWNGSRGAIAQVLPRQTELSRPPIANANQILLVFALAEPDLDPLALSRFLVKSESTGLGVCLCLNKCDLVTAQHLEQWRDRLSTWGYQPFLISVQTGMGLEQEQLETVTDRPLVANSETPGLFNPAEPSPPPSELCRQLQGQITVICGPSGVGKSSLINKLIPTLSLRVGAVSGKLGRGRHTTRHVELFELPIGGLLADTPGFNQPDFDSSPEELAYYFPEARQRLADASCQFSDCLHRDEPNCAVRGEWERYSHYLNFLEEAIARQEALQQLGDAESSLKVKSKSAGKQQYEPKLETKKYRRSSRRREHQNLQELYQDIESL